MPVVGLFSFPGEDLGGKVEPGESYLECAIRELDEVGSGSRIDIGAKRCGCLEILKMQDLHRTHGTSWESP